MTEIVDERQRLPLNGDVYTIQVEVRGPPTTDVIGREGAAYRVKVVGSDDWFWITKAALASRPQEQPRKATGEMVARLRAAIAAVERFAEREYADGADNEYAQLIRGVVRPFTEAADAFAASVSPAAAQGWQPRETAPKNGTLEWRVLMHWQDMGSSSGWSLLAMTHWRPAAPPSPAAQEQK